jgi:hypothetical protein
MATAAAAENLSSRVIAQPNDVRGIPASQRARLIVGLNKVDGELRVSCVYADDVWWTSGATTNTSEARTRLDFSLVPEPFREVTKAMMYRYMRRGTIAGRRPASGTTIRFFWLVIAFLRYLPTLSISRLQDATALVCNSYVQAVRDEEGPQPSIRKSRPGLYKRFKAVEHIFELSQYTDDPMAQHPWPDSSADHLSGCSKNRRNDESRTPLMPDEVFTALFSRAWALVQAGPSLLDLRDELERFGALKTGLAKRYITQLKREVVRQRGFDSYLAFKAAVTELRTACYVVIASLSGCRNHELANLKADSYYSTQDDEGNRYWWMRSRSIKTFEGDTEWLVPDAAVEALRVIDRWSQPHQRALADEIDGYRRLNAADLRIARAQVHVGAVFLSIDRGKGNRVRTMSISATNSDLQQFTKACSLDWPLASHQFRRKFANYAARSQFGDLRYLREHYKHWSMDMTLGYALNESQEMTLFLEIGDELDDLKVDTVSSWLEKDEPLAGGYGQNLINWRSRGDGVTLFKSHAAMVRAIAQSTPIRSNGHAWCTAQDNQCVGNDLERTRCGDGCENAVIGRRHVVIYQGLHAHLLGLQDAPDIGPGGRARVARDVQRCATVLAQLGEILETQT